MKKNDTLTVEKLKDYIKDLPDDIKVAIEDDGFFVYARHIEVKNGILKIK